MSSIVFEQVREQMRTWPPDFIQTFRAALQLETEERQKLLDELPVLRPPQHPEVKVRRGVARDFSRETEWIRAHAHFYPGEHLAISGDQLLAHGQDFGEVFDAAEATGQKFLMHRVPLKGEVWGGGMWV